MKKRISALLLAGSALWLAVVATVAGPKPHPSGTPIHVTPPPHKPTPTASAQPTPRRPHKQ